MNHRSSLLGLPFVIAAIAISFTVLVNVSFTPAFSEDHPSNSSNLKPAPQKALSESSENENNGELQAPSQAGDNAAPNDPKKFQPDFTKSVLQVQNRSLAPIRVRDYWPLEHLVGDSLIRIRDAKIEALDNSTGEIRWSFQSEVESDLLWLGECRGVAFLADIQGPSRTDNHGVKPYPGVRRLRIEDGTWLDPFDFPLDAVEKTHTTLVEGILLDGDGVLILSSTITPREADGDYRRPSNRLTRFSLDSAHVLWTKYYQSSGPFPGSGFLQSYYSSNCQYSAKMAKFRTAVQGLTRLGSNALLCCGPLEDLIAFDPTNGQELWKIPRLWEFRRRSIDGRSDYQIGRYGLDEQDLEFVEMTLEEMREKYKDQGEINEDYYQETRQEFASFKTRISGMLGMIFAAPVVVPLPKIPHSLVEHPGDRIFVATAQCHHADTTKADMLIGDSDCVVYELDENGDCIGMVNLPRFPKRRSPFVVGNSLVWNCSGNELARLYPNGSNGDADARITLDWNAHRYEDPDEEAWYQGDEWFADSSFECFYNNSTIRIHKGGFVESPESRDFCFRFELIDILTGSRSDLLLRVPFTGNLSIPADNVLQSTLWNGKETWRVIADIPLSLSGLEIQGDSLVIALQHDKVDHALVFDLKPIFNSPAPDQKH